MKRQKFVLMIVLIAILMASVVFFSAAEAKLYIPVISKGFSTNSGWQLRPGLKKLP